LAANITPQTTAFYVKRLSGELFNEFSVLVMAEHLRDLHLMRTVTL
jgi:hypothetical protein